QLFITSSRLPNPTLLPYTTLFRSFACYRAKIYDGAKLRTPQIACERIALPNIDARNKTELSTKTWREIDVFAEKIKFASGVGNIDRKSTRLNSSHDQISYAVFCLK